MSNKKKVNKIPCLLIEHLKSWPHELFDERNNERIDWLITPKQLLLLWNYLSNFPNMPITCHRILNIWILVVNSTGFGKQMVLH